MKWFYLENNDTSKEPEWVRSVGIRNDGIVLMPAAMSETKEFDVYKCALADVQFIKNIILFLLDGLEGNFRSRKRCAYWFLLRQNEL